MQNNIIIKRNMKCQGIILLFLLATSAVGLCLDSISFAANDSDMAVEAIQYRIKGYIYQRQGDFPKAIENYKKAVGRNPFYACAHNDLGILYEQIGNPAQAEEEYLNAIKVDQNYSSAYSNLALLYERQDKIEQACYYWGIRAQMGDSNNQWTQAAKKKYADLSVELADRQRSKRATAAKKHNVDRGMSQEQMDMAEANDFAKKFAVEKNKENKRKQKELNEKQRNEKLCKDYLDSATRMMDKGNYDSAIKQYNKVKVLDKNYPGIDNIIKEAQDKSIDRQYQIKMQAGQQRKAKEDALQKKQELKEKERLEREQQISSDEIDNKKANEQADLEKKKKAEEQAKTDIQKRNEQAKIDRQKQKEQERLKKDQEYQEKKAKKEIARIEKNKQKEQERLKREQDRRLREQANEQARLERLRNKQKAQDAKLAAASPEVKSEAKLKEDAKREKAYQQTKEKEAQAKRDFADVSKKPAAAVNVKPPAPVVKKEAPAKKAEPVKKAAPVKKIEPVKNIEPVKKVEVKRSVQDNNKDEQKKIQDAEKAKQQKLKEIDQHFTRGQNLYLASRYEEAAKEFEAALAMNPDHAESSRMLRYCQRRTQSGYYRPLEESIAESKVSSKQQPVSVSAPVESSPAVVAYKEPVMESPEAVEKRVSQEVKQEEKSSSKMTSADIEKKYQVLGVVAYRSESNNIDALNDELLKKAKDMGAEEVIQVRYFQNNNYVYGYGTAVKKKKK